MTKRVREIERAWEGINSSKERNGDTQVRKKSELYTHIDRSIKIMILNMTLFNDIKLFGQGDSN